ncbi:MAG: hypothetical protein HW383_89 [Candidatus Magasanikbacteria bacterium]|nr:hypothetical protein [Candidatus Magasanikbacteria bacterium]
MFTMFPIERLLKLIQKTGDRAIVIDGDNSYVVMTVPEYERLVLPAVDGNSAAPAAPIETGGEQLIDKINRDVALWRETQKKEKTTEDLAASVRENLEVAPLEVTPSEEPQYLEPVAAPAWSGLSALRDILMETQDEESPAALGPEKEEKKTETQFFFEPVE